MYTQALLDGMDAKQLFEAAQKSGVNPFQSADKLIADILAVPAPTTATDSPMSVLAAKPTDNKVSSLLEWAERLFLLIVPLWEWAQSKKIDALIDEDELELALKPLKYKISELEGKLAAMPNQTQPVVSRTPSARPETTSTLQPAATQNAQPDDKSKGEPKKGFLDGLLGN